MDITQNDTKTDHQQYEQFYQRLLKANFTAGDTIQVYLNSIERLSYTFQYAKSHLSLQLQDKSTKKRTLTDEEMRQAIDEFYNNHPELFV